MKIRFNAKVNYFSEKELELIRKSVKYYGMKDKSDQEILDNIIYFLNKTIIEAERKGLQFYRKSNIEEGIYFDSVLELSEANNTSIEEEYNHIISHDFVMSFASAIICDIDSRVFVEGSFTYTSKLDTGFDIYNDSLSNQFYLPSYLLCDDSFYKKTITVESDYEPFMEFSHKVNSKLTNYYRLRISFVNKFRVGGDDEFHVKCDSIN